MIIHRAFSFFTLGLATLCLLTSCASDAPKDRPGVKEARACVKAWRAKKIILDVYEIQSCTNNGVWIVCNTTSDELFDFLNKTYTPAGGGDVNLDDMPSDAAATFTSLRVKLNKELLSIYY